MSLSVYNAQFIKKGPGLQLSKPWGKGTKDAKKLDLAHIEASLRPIFRLSKYVGLTPYSLSTLRTTRYGRIQTVLVILFISSLNTYMFLRDWREVGWARKSLSAGFVGCCELLLLNAAACLDLAYNLLFSERKKDLLRKLYSVNLRMRVFGLHPKRDVLTERLENYVAAAFIACQIALDSHVLFSCKCEEFVPLILSYPAYIILFISFFQYVKVLTAVRLKFECVNATLLEQLAANETRWTRHRQYLWARCWSASVQPLVTAHALLRQTCRQLNLAFGPETLAIFAVVFIIVTSNSYYTIYLALRKAAEEDAFFNLYYGCFTVALLATISYVVGKTSAVCMQANSTARIIHQLLLSNVRDKVKNELQLFSLQLIHEKVNFTACGFFPLDLSVLFNTISSVVTYLIILIQLQISTQESSVFKVAMKNNATAATAQ
ncbi:unnamed protein product [Bemisia tabaci]|uniref:Gustatory receptor n=1 Tax=Bemisia tabaci TaxID=7038 RepID=A0A9P0AMB1_BEMTA|nr:unnamed protein product [Bemisia tabaci]